MIFFLFIHIVKIGFFSFFIYKKQSHANSYRSVVAYSRASIRELQGIAEVQAFRFE